MLLFYKSNPGQRDNLLLFCCLGFYANRKNSLIPRVNVRIEGLNFSDNKKAILFMSSPATFVINYK